MGVRFLLSDVRGSYRLDESSVPISAAADAVKGLRDNTYGVVGGALSFEPGSPDSLWGAPEIRTGPPVDARPPRIHPVSVKSHNPEPALHIARVAEVVSRIRARAAEKVVAARSVDLLFDDEIDIEALVSSLAAANANAEVFGVDLSAGGAAGHTLVGASPELLVEKRGAEVFCHPLAGSARRHADADADRAAAAELVTSDKNHREHRFVVEHIREVLAPLCESLHIQEDPTLLGTGAMWHLGTPITGRLADPSMTSLELAMILAPTPAVCGVPTDAARAIIAELEEPRGFYGGAVGFSDAHGDGRWMVTIRCAEIFDDQRTVRAWAGGGIVADSDPHAELAETTAKFATILRSLGCPDALD